MAAAAIGIGLPILEAVAPQIISLIAGLVHKQAPIAEAANGPSTGPVKLADVFAYVMESLTTAAGKGTIPKALPSDPLVMIIIQAVVSSLQLSGQLGNAAPALPGSSTAPAGTQILVLKSGQSILITVQ